MKIPPRPIALAAVALRRRLKLLADTLVPPEVCVLDISTAMAATHVTAALARLRIADVLGDRALTSAQVAEEIHTNPDTTHRLLRGAVSYGLCTMNPKTGVVKLTRRGKVLRSDHPHSLRSWATYMGLRSHTEAWSDLADSVRSGQSAFRAVHGMSIWDWLASHPEEERLFASAMREATALIAPAIVAAYPWHNGGVVCDIGGGIGALLSAVIAESDADLRGVVVDGPGTIAKAQRYIESRGLSNRIDCVVGDIFGTITATADVYLLKDVLHDWDDDCCHQILSNVAATMHSGSRLVLIEITQRPNAPNPLAHYADLLMLAYSDGGRQRSVPELVALLTEAGLRPVGPLRSAGPYDLLEALKP